MEQDMMHAVMACITVPFTHLLRLDRLLCRAYATGLATRRWLMHVDGWSHARYGTTAAVFADARKARGMPIMAHSPCLVITAIWVFWGYVYFNMSVCTYNVPYCISFLGVKCTFDENS